MNGRQKKRIWERFLLYEDNDEGDDQAIADEAGGSAEEVKKRRTAATPCGSYNAGKLLIATQARYSATLSIFHIKFHYTGHKDCQKMPPVFSNDPRVPARAEVLFAAIGVSILKEGGRYLYECQNRYVVRTRNACTRVVAAEDQIHRDSARAGHPSLQS